MSDVQVHSHGLFVRLRVCHGTKGTQGFSERSRGPSVEQPVGLSIALDGHRAHYSFGRQFLDLNAQATNETVTELEWVDHVVVCHRD